MPPPNDALMRALSTIYHQFVKIPADRVGGDIAKIQALGNTSPQTFPQDLGNAAMGVLGVLGSPSYIFDAATKPIGQVTTPEVGQALSLAGSIPLAGPAGGARNLAATGGREAAMMEGATKMGQFARREAFGRGTERVGRNIADEVMALRNKVAQELGFGTHSTNVSDEVGKRIDLDQASHLWDERERWMREWEAIRGEAKRTGQFPKDAMKMVNERGQVPEEIVSQFILREFGPPAKGIKYTNAEVAERLNWLKAGGSPQNFPK